MSFYTRLRGYDYDDVSGTYIVAEKERKLSGHDVHGAFWEIYRGNLTLAQVKIYFQTTPAEDADLDNLAAIFTGLPNAASKERFITSFEVVALLARERVPGYRTDAEFLAKLQV